MRLKSDGTPDRRAQNRLFATARTPEERAAAQRRSEVIRQTLLSLGTRREKGVSESPYETPYRVLTAKRFR